MTDYLLAKKKDFIECAAFTGNQPEDFLWPVIMAKRNNVLIGVMATQNRDELVVAGPLKVDLPNPAFVALRLIDYYDRVMAELGIKKYYLSVLKEDEKWNQSILKSGLSICGDFDQYHWYVRELCHQAQM